MYALHCKAFFKMPMCFHGRLCFDKQFVANSFKFVNRCQQQHYLHSVNNNQKARQFISVLLTTRGPYLHLSRGAKKIPERFKQKKLFFEVDTTVSDTTLLFSNYKSKRRAQMFTGVGIFMFILLVQSADLIYRFVGRTTAETKKDAPWYYWWTKIDYSSKVFKYTLMGILVSFGIVVLAFSILFPARMVREISLLPGGKRVMINTYGLFGKEKKLEVPITELSAVWGPKQSADVLPVKVKGRRFFYQVYMQEGTVHNRPIFDETIARSRFDE